MILRFYLNNVSRLLKKHYLCIRDIFDIYMNVKLSLFFMHINYLSPSAYRLILLGCCFSID